MVAKEGEEAPPTKTCFVICPIGDENSPERQWSNDVLDCVITPTVEKLGYKKPIRADHINESGIITRQIVDLLIDSDLVIADLSYRNPNVCYELAVRHVAKKPFIHMIRNGHKIPFDTSSNRAITFDIDIRSANKAMKDLENHILSIENGKNEMDNPIGTALDLRNLRSSGDPSQMMSADLIETLQNLSADVRSLREGKSNPYAYLAGTPASSTIGSNPSTFYRMDKRTKYLLNQYNELYYRIRDQKAHNVSEKSIAKLEMELFEIANELRDLGISLELDHSIDYK